MPLDSAYGILTDSSTKSCLVDVVKMLREQSDGDDMWGVLYPRIFECCRARPQDYMEVARAVQAAFALDPPRAMRCLECLVDKFDADIPGPPVNPLFTYGALLGFFKAMSWIEKEWRSETLRYGKREFQSLMAEWLMSPRLAPGDGWVNDLPDERYGGRLSEAVVDFVRHGNVGARMSDIFQLMGRFTRAEEEVLANVQPLAWMVVERLCWTEYNHWPEKSKQLIPGFDSLDPHEKAVALYTFYIEQLPSPRPTRP